MSNNSTDMRCSFLLALLGTLAPLVLQHPVGAQETLTLSGRVIEQGAGAVPSAIVRARAESSGSERWTLTDERGRYVIHLPANPGPVFVWVERVGFRSDTVRVAPAAGRTRTRDLVIAAAPILLPELVVSPRKAPQSPLRGRSPGGGESTTLSAHSGSSPLDPGSLAELAARSPGAFATGDDPWGAGISFGAQPASQTGVTVDGASFGATTLPEEAVQSVTVAASSYDVSRGQFSGGQVAARTNRGTDQPGVSGTLWTTHPALQTGGGAAGPGSVTLLRASGGGGGPLVPGWLYGFAAVQINLLESPSGALETAGGERLRSFGVEPDSAARFLAAVREAGASGAEEHGGPRSAQGSAIARLDFEPSPDHTVTIRLDGRRMHLRGIGESPLSVASAAGELRDGAGGLLMQIGSQFGRADNTFRAYRSRRDRDLSPLLAVPAGVVGVGGADLDGASIPRLRFGGSTLGNSANGSLVEVANDLQLPLGKRRLGIGVLLVEERERQHARFNASGTFAFRTIDDLVAGRPSAYSRTFAGESVEAISRHTAVYLGETRRGTPLSLTYGLRAEARSFVFPRVPGEAVFEGRWPGPPASRWGVSPRLGFSYQRTGSPVTIRGGVGEFRGRLSPSVLAAAAAESGSEGSARHLLCLGAAAPTPEWRRYAHDPAAVPAECAEGTGELAAGTRRLTLFGPDFSAPRVWRGSAGVSVQIRRSVYLHMDASILRGVDQPLVRDLNLPAEPAFIAAGEGRPVHAPAAAIDSASGAISLAGVRPHPAFGTVREVFGDGRSTTAQLAIQAGTLYRMAVVNAHYTFTRAVDEVGPLSGFDGSLPIAAPDGSARLRATRDLERRHAMWLEVSRPRGRYEYGVTVRLTSGVPYTPLVEGDVNGDGRANDPAFIFAPGAEGAAGMRELLADAPAHARRCLERQLGRFAGRNSCRGPWEAGMDLRLNLFPSQKAHRWTLSALVLDLPAGVDRLLHGTRPRGWGRGADPDPVLLRVKGFDPAGSAFRYRANPGFGRTREFGLGGEGFRVLLQGRISVGADPRRQPLRVLETMLRTQGRTPAEMRRQLAERLPNLPAQVLGLDAQLGLGLTPPQGERLRAAAATLGSELAVLADSLALASSVAERSEDDQVRTAAQRERRALVHRTLTLLDRSVEELRELLTPAQWARLPQPVREPARQIVPTQSLFIPFGEP